MESRPKSMELFRKHQYDKRRQDTAPHDPTAPNLKVMTDEDLYTYLKECETDYKKVLKAPAPRPIVLDRASVYITQKNRTVAAFTEMMLRDTAEEILQSKKIAERFWDLMKKELKRGEKEAENSPADSFSRLLRDNEQLLKDLLRKFWEKHEVKEHLNDPDDIYRKSAAVLHFGIAEVTKLKYTALRAKQDKALIPALKDLYFRTLRMYSHSGKVCENLASKVHTVCNQLLGDYLGSVYWTIRSLAAIEAANTREQLLKNYDFIRENWEKHQSLESVSDQPRWYITFCLSLLRLHGILFSKINTENLEMLLGVCLENFSTFLKQPGDPDSLRNHVNLLTYIIHMWIFTAHHCVHDYKSIATLRQGDYPELFSDSALQNSDFSSLCISFFSRFIERLANAVTSAQSVWLGPLLVFLYWLGSYRNLPSLFFRTNPKLQPALFAVHIELMTGMENVDENRLATQAMLPEDLLSIGFLPLHDFFRARKDLKGVLVEAQQVEAVRMCTAARLIDDLNLDFEEQKRAIEELPIDLDDQFGAMGSMDTPGLIFREETKAEKRLVLIDGPNVAMRHGNGRFSCKGIKLALEYFMQKGFSTLAVIPEQRLEEDTARYLSQKREMNFPVPAAKVPDAVGILRDLDRQSLLVKTPPWDYDDSYCIKYAQEKGAIIITNDRYQDYIEKEKGNRRWVREHCCSFTFAGDDFLPNPDFPPLR